MERFVSEAQRVVTDAAATTPVMTMPLWLVELKGFAAELAFWCAIMVAVGRAAWLLWDLWDRWHRRSAVAEAKADPAG